MGPLNHLRVAVTRPASQAEELARPLRAAGAAVIIAPLIRVQPAVVHGRLREAARNAASYDWVVFSSANGVQLFLEALRAVGLDRHALQSAKIACVGPATASAARENGLAVDVVPEKFVGDAIVDALRAHTQLSGERVLLARAGGARAELADGLRAHGAHVEDIEVYRSVPDETGAQLLDAYVKARGVDVVTFTAPSAVRVFHETSGAAADVTIAVIGPVTAQAVRQCGYQVGIEADPHTVDGLVAALKARYARRDELEES